MRLHRREEPCLSEPLAKTRGLVTREGRIDGGPQHGSRIAVDALVARRGDELQAPGQVFVDAERQLNDDIMVAITPQRSSMRAITSIEPSLLSGSLRLPHLGDCTHDGQPRSHGHSEIRRCASATSVSNRS